MTGTDLADLQWDWGGAYLITGMSGRWLAQRRDDGQTLTAPGPEELRELITEDHGAQPVSREAALVAGWLALPAHVQATALTAAFPGYMVNVLSRRGGRPRFEAVRRDGGSPYCLISDDAREIWRELRRCYRD